MRELHVRYEAWDAVVSANPTMPTFYVELPSGEYSIHAGYDELIFHSGALEPGEDNDKAHYEQNHKSAAEKVPTIDDAVAFIIGSVKRSGQTLKGDKVKHQQKDSRGNPVVVAALPEGSRLNLPSQNFCDRTTWFSKSIRRLGVAMLSTPDPLVFKLQTPTVLVDVHHGKITAERRLRADHGAIVYDNGAALDEDLLGSTSHDVVIDYLTGEVTFQTAPIGPVTIDYSEVTTSEWYITPDPGKKIRLTEVELQFSRDSVMNDSIIFQPRAAVGQHPLLPSGTGGYPDGTVIPLGSPTIYQTKLDLVNESNLSYPIIPKDPNPGARGLVEDIEIFRWEYKDRATIDLVASYGMDVEIRLENHQENGGWAAIATFYGRSEDEA